MTANEVFLQTDGDVTKAYYAWLNALGLKGQLAVALFRAQKRSSAAKSYRGGKYRRAAYDVKNWSLGEICRVLALMPTPPHWGWKHDPNTPGYEWVLYIELPVGQVSFHSAVRLAGPDFTGEWDGRRNTSTDRILAFCMSVEQTKETR